MQEALTSRPFMALHVEKLLILIDVTHFTEFRYFLIALKHSLAAPLEI